MPKDSDVAALALVYRRRNSCLIDHDPRAVGPIACGSDGWVVGGGRRVIRGRGIIGAGQYCRFPFPLVAQDGLGSLYHSFAVSGLGLLWHRALSAA